MPGAFDGIRIIDFTQVLAGPFGVMQLALLGAGVIKIEQPITGDQTRGIMSTEENLGMSPSFMGMNLNKKSLTLNLKSPEAVEIVKKLVDGADVLVENFKAGTMERMGLGYDDLKQLRPDLIYCSVTGYGQTGPKAGQAAYDGAIQASSGMMSQTGHVDTGPTRTGYMPVDMGTALNTAFSISASIYRRAMTGKGQRIDVAMMDTAIVMQAAQYSNYLNQGSLIGLNGNASPTGQPTANVFPTQDGFIQITAIRQPQIEKLFTAIDRTEDFTRPEFNTPKARAKHPEEVNTLMCDALNANTTAYWMKFLAGQGIPVAEVRELPEVINDPQFKERGVFETLPSPADIDKDITVVKAGYITNEDGPEVRSGPPKLGEHTEEILLSLEYSLEDIAGLKDRGVI
ncbi:MAG: CoA transferase [Pseudomonadales bacterium]|jgi:formyl-CoA transferase